MLNLIVEDTLSEAVLLRLLSHVGYRGESVCRVMRGYAGIRKSLPKYLGACHFSPHIILTDLDQYLCPPELISQWNVADIPDNMLFRIAVCEVEAWLMADRERISGFLDVAKEKVPFEPEKERDPKVCLFGIVRKSRKRRLKSEILPSSGAHIGPMYNEHFCRFVRDVWHVEAAAENAPSLAKCLERLTEFVRCTNRFA